MSGRDPKDDLGSEAELADDTVFGDLTVASEDPAEVNDVTSGTPDPAESAAADEDTTDGAPLGRSPTPAFPLASTEHTPLVWDEKEPSAEQPTESALALDNTPLRPEPTAHRFGPQGSAVAPRPRLPSAPLRPSEVVHAERAPASSEGSVVRARRPRPIRSPPTRPLPPPAQSFAEWARDAAERLADFGDSAVRRFERLPSWQQLLWVAAPYVATVLVIGRLLFPSTTSVDVSSERKPARPTKVAEATGHASAPPSQASSAAPVLTPNDPLRTRIFAVRRRTALYVRPDSDARRAGPVPRGHSVTVYPDFPSPVGWVLAQSENGVVGFISTRYLADRRGRPADSKDASDARSRIVREPPMPPSP